MSNQRSSGSKLSAIAGVVIIIAFFLPWVRACGTDFSGLDLATNDTGQVEDPGQYWLALLSGLVCVALFFTLKTRTRRQRVRAAVTRLVVGAIGFLPLLNVWYNVKERGESLELLYGGWITLLGFIGIGISSLMDLMGRADQD
jgi:drug/metabolite transporter (DMT)-like permease